MKRPGPFTRLIRWWCLMLVCALLGTGAWAENGDYLENRWNFVENSMEIAGGIPEAAEGVLARIRERGILRVATEPYFPPQEFIDPSLDGQDQYAGADMEMARLLAERMGVSLEIIPLEFTQVLPALADDLCDLAISALAYTPGRASSYTLSKGYYYTQSQASTTLMIHQEDAEAITDIDALGTRIIAAQSGSLQEALAAENVATYLEFRRFPSAQDVYLALREGQVDAAFVDMETGEAYLRNNPDAGLALVTDVVFHLEEQFEGDRVAAKKGETALIAFVNAVIDELLESDQYNIWIQEAQERVAELEREANT